MGILDHTTNNILVDAVLTERGREVFASNGANLDEAGLVFVKFALADDEVDYTNLIRYGIELGRERIEKVTPVFEASTNTNLAMRYLLASYSSDNLETMPRLAFNGGPSDTIDVARQAGPGATTTATVSLGLVVGSGASAGQTPTIDQVDPLYLVKVPGRFLEIRGFTPVSSSSDRTDLYEIPATGTTSASLVFEVGAKQFPLGQFDQAAAFTGSPDVIRTRITIVGVASGATKEIKVNIRRA